MQLEDWLDDLCVRFIINLPPEELESVERICFQVEEAQWFYEDFIRPLDPSLPSLSLRAFSLRMFQHCPLFSQWSAHHYTTAFAEFLAYKSRVPVRGAIMLNEAMDEVVLVKGWKKSANWSFPRGKINKDEDDLDCAIREVYEETGFDLKAAGLVKPGTENDFVEAPMREQHIKLYVFRGVSKDTYFEPRTRKEISKIEWYKLSDLPTQKRHNQQNTSGIVPATNANKFYMVAPFLHGLKKWINAQKKKNNRYSSHLSAPPILAEDSEIETANLQQELGHSQQQIPSDLPEVTLRKTADPTAHLKELLNIGSPSVQQPTDSIANQHRPTEVDVVKSNALLSLLRGEQTAELRGGPMTPLEQASHPTQVPDASHEPHIRQLPSVHDRLPLPFHVQTELPISPPAQTALQSRQPFSPTSNGQGMSTFEAPGFPLSHSKQLPQRAPYQQTGDPDFARQVPLGHVQPVVPPASALPKLTTHAKSLLDMLKGTPPLVPTQVAVPAPILPLAGAPSQGPSVGSRTAKNPNLALLDLFKGTARPEESVAALRDVVVDTRGRPGLSRPIQTLKDIAHEPHVNSPSGGTIVHRPQKQSTDLLSLFKQGKPGRADDSAIAAIIQNPHLSKTPAELAATSPIPQPAKLNESAALLALFQQQKGATSKAATRAHRSDSTVKEGETAATIDGPLNQPIFDAIPRTPKDNTFGMRRSPLGTHRTLFDPKQPQHVKILARPDESRPTTTKSPRVPKAKAAAASPKRHTSQTRKEAQKPFQPQILRRPQASDTSKSSVQLEPLPSSHDALQQSPDVMASERSRNLSSEREGPVLERKTSQADTHKQNLLSLFGGPSVTPLKTEAVQIHTSSQTPSRVVSPLSTSQIISPITEGPISGVEPMPISTRSRMGSLVSMTSSIAPSRPATEKRQTGAENKSFLLGYLGRMATQDS